MILLLLSAAQGPNECCLAVSKVSRVLLKEADSLKLDIRLLEEIKGHKRNTVKSILFAIDGEAAVEFAKRWSGTIQWICNSPFRLKIKRKNWFISGSYTQYKESMVSNDIKFEACRSSGPGGQHANKTSSAVRAVHLASGIDVKVQSERSQHANKRLAIALIERKLEEKEKLKNDAFKRVMHKSHHLIERGNATRTFKGINFLETV